MSTDDVKRQFGKTADSYVKSSSHSSGRGLDLLVESVEDLSGVPVLDIATGGGHTAFSLAERGAEVTALDITPEILSAAKKESEKRGFSITYVEGNAEALPFGSHEFAIVTCRIAPHHFRHPEKFVDEVSRVLNQNGWFFLIDNVSSEREDFAESLNHIEKLRDPSHVRAYRVAEWCKWISHAGMDICHLERWKKTKDFGDWARRSQTPPLAIEEICEYVSNLNEDVKRYLDAEIDSSGIKCLAHEIAFISAKKLTINWR